MSFALSNSGGTVDATTPLSRANTYIVRINPTSETSPKTADYDISFSPAGAITGIATNTNSLTFRVNNTGATKVTITAKHKDNPAITKTLTLNFAPRADFMSFLLTNGSGTVDIKTPLARASTYGLTIKPTSETLLQTADYDIAFSPVDAITINTGRSSSNVLNFTVNNSDATSVTITATHKDNPVITKTLELTFKAQVDFMSFAVSNIEGALLTTDTALIYRSNYMVSITPTSTSPLPTADYDIVFSPESAITRTAISTNSISFTVNDGSTSVTITATHKNNSAITKTLSLTFKPRADFMSFTLTNRSGILAPTTPLARANSYGVSVKRENGADEKTADYTFRASPADAITIDIRRSNSIDFTVKNTADMTVSITAIHKDDTSIVETLVLDLAPPANFMNFAVSNVGGLLLGTTTPLTHGKRYMVSITPTSASPLLSADYDIAFSPESAITELATNTNSISFRVNDGTTALTISATHKDNPLITKTLSLSFVRDYMSFTLTNRSGTVDTATGLDRASRYGLSVKRENGAELETADYTFSASPTDAITINTSRSSSNAIDFMVNNTSDMAVTITATHRDDTSITESLILNLAPQADFMSFVLTNRSGTVDTTTALARASSYGLTINPTSESPLQAADYDITFSPVGAITGIATNTNALSFTVNNSDATSIRITATHKDNPVITKTLELRLAPPADFMNFVLSNVGGALVDTATLLNHGNRYELKINPTSASPFRTADYDIAYAPADAITELSISTNSLSFKVNDGTTALRITATHKDNPIISQTLDLSFVRDYMSFTLTNRSGTIDTTTALVRYNSYGLIVSREGGANLRTADYIFSATPANAITIDVRHTNAIDFTVNNTSDMAVRITATHKDDSAITETLGLRLESPFIIGGTFQQDIENITTVPNLAIANVLTREVLTPLGVPTGTPLVKRYVTENGGGAYDGSSWANAWAATNLRNGINRITDASTSKVYLVMIAGGIYLPTYDGNRDISFSMRNHVAIMGGFQASGGWERNSTTFMSGDIGTAGSTTDNSYSVFLHGNLVVGLALGNSHLYGVTITNGNANGAPNLPETQGGGMYNYNASSPNLTRVVFSGNSAKESGGGMYNSRGSSPVLNRVVFSRNTATGTGSGGGMYNDNSLPVLNRVVFSGNTANNGGGMFNHSSSPNLTQATFSGNTTTHEGGGMFNFRSSPVLNNTVFSGNTAANDGGGMFNRDSSPVLSQVVFSGNTANRGGGMGNSVSSVPVIRNTVFSGNTANNQGGGMYNTGSYPVLNNTVFSGNTAIRDGGGMFNYESAPVLVGAVFSGNSAVNGGGMLNENGRRRIGPRILNTIFSGNTGTTTGPDIAMNIGGFAPGPEPITIAGSVLGTYLTTGTPTDAIVGYNGGDTIIISNHSLSRNAVNLTGTATLTVNGMDFTYPTITAGSSAINLGLYVRRSGGTYYYSDDNTTWYSGFNTAGNFSGDSVTPPADAEDLSATDITGKARTGRPDAGVNEF